MSILNSILGQVSDTATVQNGNVVTVTAAAEQTGVPQDKLQEIVNHIGGEGALGRFASLLREDGAAGGMLGQIKSMF